eukprot:Gb_00852 [translate_table: standard]
MALAKQLSHQQRKLVLCAKFLLSITSSAFRAEREHATGNNSGLSDIYGFHRTQWKEGQSKGVLHILRLKDYSNSSYVSLLRRCDNYEFLPEGKLVHAHIIQTGFRVDVFLGNTLVIMYAKCGSLLDARRVLDKMPKRNVVSCTAMISAYASHGYSEEALALHYEMQRTGIQSNEFTFASVLPACGNLSSLKHGKEVHQEIIRRGFQFDVFVGSALVDMYIKCRVIDDALKVFDKMPERNVVSWTAMIAGYAQSGHVDEALRLFEEMPERNVFSWTAMVAGYAQNGHVEEALELFQKMPERPVVSWNAMIAGYAQNGYFNETLNLFRKMQLATVKPDSVTFASILPACANSAALEHGKEVHEEIIRSGFHSVIFVGNALIDMYAKCGSVEDARKVFDKSPTRDTVSWSSMIVGYAMHGCGKEALQLFEQMQRYGTKPDHVTLVGVLSACCHAGLVNVGWQYFDSMSRDYDIKPAVEHYCCMVDLLGRAGHLSEAYDFINRMPIKPDAAVWVSLLGACRIHTNLELGERVAERLFELNPNNAAHYVLLSNLYAVAGRWDGVEKVRKMMKDRKVQKMPACSWIEVNSKLHAFLVGEGTPPQT